MVLKILVNAHNFINNKIVRDRICSKKADRFICSTEKASQCWGQEKKAPDWKRTCQFYAENIFRVMDHYGASYEEKLKLDFLTKQKRYQSPGWTNKLLLNNSKSITSLLPSSSKSITSYYWNVKQWEKFVGRAQKTERKEWQTALSISKNQLTCLYRWLLRDEIVKKYFFR